MENLHLDNLQLLRLLHSLAGALLFVALFALAALCWRSRTRRVAVPEEGGAAEMDAALAPLEQVPAPTDQGPVQEPEAEAPDEASDQTPAKVPPRTLLWPVLCAVLLLLCLVGLPVSGWWLAHLETMSLGLLWVVGSSLLFLPGSLCALWLASRVTGRRSGVRLSLTLAFLGLLCFGASLALMVEKPLELQRPAWLVR